MKKNGVGITGGGMIRYLGNKEEMQEFFHLIDRYTKEYDSNTDYNLILDRLYKRYLKLEELEETKRLLNRIQNIFFKIPCDAEYIRFLNTNMESSSVNFKAKNLKEFFEEYFYIILKTIDSAIFDHEYYKKKGEFSYRRVRITKQDIVQHTIDEMRPNEIYDNLEGEPYWIRESVVDWDASKK